MTKTNKTSRNILIAFLLNFIFSIYEFVGGTFTGSTAIMSDAVHDLGDAISIGIAYFLEKHSQKQPDKTYTYGYARYSLFGSIITTLVLLAGSCFVIINAILHIVHPAPINYNGMIMLAVIGAIVNFIAAYFTSGKDSLNQKSVNLHMLEDVLGWIVVLAGAIIMRFTDITYLDPILSIAVAIFILKHALANFKATLAILLEKTPAQISIDDLCDHLQKIPHVESVHHVHVWSLDEQHNYATLHVVTKSLTVKLKHSLRNELAEHGITHSTIEFETPSEHCDAQECHLEPTTIHHHSHNH